MSALRGLEQILQERFEQHLAAVDPEAPAHRVEFSRRITTSWALIYYQRRVVRLSPYLFLLEPHALKHGSHWRELDATLRHEAAHAAMFARHGETGHTSRFHAALAALGVRANGMCDLGPENEAFRYVYGCPSCDARWPRRAPLRGNYSCGLCAPGRYAPEHRLDLVQRLDPWGTLRARERWIATALADARAEMGVRPALVAQ